MADKIYRNRDNLRFCKEHGIRLSGPALGRPKKDAATDKKQEYADIFERVEVERRISLAKRKCGLGLFTTRLPETIRIFDLTDWTVVASTSFVGKDPPLETGRSGAIRGKAPSTSDVTAWIGQHLGQLVGT